MDTNRQDALVELESELRVNLSLVGIIPLLEKTQDGRGGFMTREEKISVVAEKGDPNRVSKVIEILRKKDNDAFDRFREILKRSGNEVWEKTLREYVERVIARRSEKHLGKVRTDKVYINEPQMPDLEDHLRKMNHELCAYILQLQPEEKYTTLKIYCEEYIGSLKRSNPFEHHRYPLPDDRQEMWWEIREFWNQLDVRFPAKIIIDVIKDRELSILLEEHHNLIAKFSGNTLEQFHKKSIGLSDDPHLTVKVKGNPTMKMILDLQDYLVKLGVKESLFKGFTYGSVVLYFLISPASAKLLPPTLSTYFPELHSMGILTVAVPGQWEADIATRKITMDMTQTLTMAEREKEKVRRSTKERSLDTDSVRLGGSQREVFEVARTSEQTIAEVEMKVFAKGHEYSRFGILVVGKTGTGKSRLINNIFAEYVAPEGDDLDSETEGIVQHKGQVRGSEVIVYDTQGFADSKSANDEQILEEIGKLNASNQIDLTVFCVSMKDTRLDQDIKRTFTELNRIGLNWKNTVIVLTFADEFHVPLKKKGMRAQYFPERVTEWRRKIQEHLKGSVGLSPELADRIAVYPATYDYNVRLPSKEDWFSPLWLAILKALPNNGVLQFMRMHQENFAKEHHVPQLEGIQEEHDVGLQERAVQRLPPQDQRPQDQRPQDQQEAELQPHRRPNINVDEQTLWDIIKEKFGAAGKKVWRWIQCHILRRETINPDEEQADINV